MRISREEVTKIAALAHLDLTEDEIQSFTSQLSAIVSYIDQLNEIDTSNVAPMSHCQIGEDPGQTEWRADETAESPGQSVALDNSPESGCGYFKVPKVL